MQIVGIGASAGGIEAFRLFFEKMPSDSGMGFVVTLHQSADRKSLLADIIARWTDMKVAQAVENDAVVPNKVLVIPPGFVAYLRDGRLHLRPLSLDLPRDMTSIDQFFDSLASDVGENAIGIVLSGTGHDGALGLKAIKARGGMTMAQGTDGSGPEHSGMPNSAIATGAVDLIVSIDDMPRLLMAARSGTEIISPVSSSVIDVTSARLGICEILHAKLGHDFSKYKSPTFMRRVERRMQVLGVGTVTDYIGRLEHDREEVVLLFRDLLIGVTAFFRDADAFEAVKTIVIPKLFEGKGANDSVRVWVPGCATGEEAYSLAILIREYMDGLKVIPRVQIFATDIDEAAIANARSGRYPATLLDGLSPPRRDRFFSQSENTYLVKKDLRDLCTFSAHSLVRDPPFSRIDLVSCRNLLIYMDNELQASVIPAFHYSLVPGGLLLLGNSESVTRHEDLFLTIDKTHRIFQRRDGVSPPLKIPARFAGGAQTGSMAALEGGMARGESRTDWPRSLAVAATRVLERFACPYVVVTEQGDVAHYSSHRGSVLQPTIGAPSRNVFDMVRPALRHSLRTALRSAAESGRMVEQQVATQPDGTPGLTLIVEPLPGQEPDRPFMIVFKEATPAGANPAQSAAGADANINVELEHENRDLREHLQSLSEEHETALEELRSTNEELHSVNEELQSSNEELETSKEEIQSVNEELQTVNAQLTAKVEELDQANSDLRNLFESTNVATVFLDQHHIIRAYTPAVSEIYNLIPSDNGRPLADIVSRLDYQGLYDDVQHVMKTLQPMEKRVSRLDRSRYYLARIIPYRAPDSTMDGSLVTFVDVTRIVQAEVHQRLLVDELNHRVKNMLTVVISLATQTLRRASSMADFKTVFLGRVHALTAAYGLLSRENWANVRLDEIITEELRPYVARDRENIRMNGPPIPLDPRAALALGLAIHELATNAVKYGALSVPEGDIAVEWGLDPAGNDGHFTLEWVERNGPAVTPPETRGFGSMLIERALDHDMSAQVKIEFPPEGVRAYIRAPVRNGSDLLQDSSGS